MIASTVHLAATALAGWVAVATPPAPPIADVERVATVEELVELIEAHDLRGADLGTRTAICFAVDLPFAEANRALLSSGWPGPFYPGAGVGRAELVAAPAAGSSAAPGTPPVALRFAVDELGRSRPAIAEPGDAAGVAAARAALRRYRYQPARVNGRPGVVCHRQAFAFPAATPPDPYLPAPLTEEMVAWVRAPEELLDMVAEAEVLSAAAETRASICALNEEALADDLNRRLFELGWPGPFLRGAGDLRAARPMSKRRQPQYTEEARRDRVEGAVVVRMAVDVHGRTYGLRVLEPLDDGLDAQALASFRDTAFEPGRLFGRTVDSCQSFTVNFALQ